MDRSDIEKGHISPSQFDTPGSSQSGSRPNSMVFASPKIEDLDQEKVCFILFRYAYLGHPVYM